MSDDSRNKNNHLPTFRPPLTDAEVTRLYLYINETGVRVGHFVRRAIIEKLEREEGVAR